jgi:hypothetical protein
MGRKGKGGKTVWIIDQWVVSKNGKTTKLKEETEGSNTRMM